MNSIEPPLTPQELLRLQRDAELGRMAIRFVDRAGDVHPGIDDAETICEDFHKAMCLVLESHFNKPFLPKNQTSISLEFGENSLKFGGCPSCNRADCIARSCTQNPSEK